MDQPRPRLHRGLSKPVVMIGTTVALGVVVWFGNGIFGAARAHAAEQDMLETLSAAVAPMLQDDTLADDLIGDAVISGRVAVVNMESGRVESYFWQRLPTDLRADTVDEIGTLVAYLPITVQVGTYQNADTGDESGRAYQTMYDVRVIDVAQNRITHHEMLMGDRPADTVTFEGDNHGVSPRAKLLRYVKALPRN